MKRVLILASLMGFVHGNGPPAQEPVRQQVPAEYGYIVDIGQQVPDFEMTLTDGATVRMSDLRGKVVLLQFTASWCGVCRGKMPHIESDIWLPHKENPDFALYGVDLDEPLDTVIRFGKDVGITYPLALDPDGRIFYSFAERGAGVSRNVVIDRDGRIVFLTRLFQPVEYREMIRVIERLLQASR